LRKFAVKILPLVASALLAATPATARTILFLGSGFAALAAK
jgi:hypothetical protein